MLPVGVERMSPSEWRVVRWIGGLRVLALLDNGDDDGGWWVWDEDDLGIGEERLRLRCARWGEGERWRVKSLRAWRVCGGWGDDEGG